MMVRGLMNVVVLSWVARCCATLELEAIDMYGCKGECRSSGHPKQHEQKEGMGRVWDILVNVR